MPVTNPEVETVAIPVLLLLHVPPAVASNTDAVVPLHTKEVPVIGNIGFTVATIVALHPVVPAKYVMIAVPPTTPVTTPLPEPTVAIAVLAELQVPDPAGSFNVTVAPAHTGALPVIAPGKLLTVIAVVVIQPEVVV
jgi:hypothetical protein